MEGTKVYIEFKDIFTIMIKRKRILFAVVITALIASIFYRIQLMKPVYEARASVIIGNALEFEETQFKIDDIVHIQNYMQTYVMLLKTNVVAEKTIDTLNLDISVGEFKNRIQGVPQPKTQFMEIKVKWDNSDQAKVVLDTITEIFIQEAHRIYPAYKIKILEKVGPYTIDTLSNVLFYLVSFIISLLAAISIVLIVEYFDDTIASEEDVEKLLNLPVLGSIPKYKKSENDILNLIKRNEYSSSDFVWAFRTNFLFQSRKLGIQSIVVTSPRHQEGKTTIASILAISLAQGGKKTLLIDCDLRSPSIHDIFSLNVVGLSNFLIGNSDLIDAIYGSKFRNLYLMPAGFSTLHPVELISSNGMRSLLTNMKEKFDYIIIDTPPVGLFTEAQVLSQLTDGCLMVVSAKESDRKMSLKAVKLIQYAEGRILGALLNKSADSK